MINLLEPFNHIKTFMFDVDGVFTDSTLLITEKGDLLRVMNTRDGFAVKTAIQAGYNIFVITGGRSEGVMKRLKGLGVTEVFWGIQDKMLIYKELLNKYGLDENHILYMGDDLPDVHVMRRVGLAACPSDAVPEIIAISGYISPRKGGAGCVRDVIEKTLRIQDKWPVVDE